MYKYIKRLLDVIIAMLAVIILSPLMIVTAMAVKLESDGPVIFKQERLGLNGKVFKIFKFRSMCQGAEHTGSGVYSGADDDRVTKVGKFIRATSIDELPKVYFLGIAIFIICDTWVKLIFMAFLFCIISFIITIFVVLNKNERKSFMLLFQNLLNKIR